LRPRDRSASQAPIIDRRVIPAIPLPDGISR
jgi:hypothetical protein